MPSYRYYCTAVQDSHEIEIAQERVDANDPDGGRFSKFGPHGSPSGQPPRVVSCPEHRGWAVIANA